MPKKEAKTQAQAGKTAAGAPPPEPGKRAFCSLPPVPPRIFKPGVSLSRAQIIISNGQKWVNGTMLNYYFFREPDEWTTTNREKEVVRKAFATWKEVGLGLEFREVDSRDDSQVRIGFLRGDGAWSYIGRDILTIGRDERTMNFGWDLTGHPSEIDTAIHEIGHSLGLEHEHQNPRAGIVWDEEAVYAALAQPPNNWDRETTYYNIIRKISPQAVTGSVWDPNSIMEYAFEAGLILEPAQYRGGLIPAGGLSEKDKTWVKTFYPPLTGKDYTELVPFKSVELEIPAGQQRNFTFTPHHTRKYTIQTFGTSDTVMVLFEEVDGELVQIAGDDDSGEDYNAKITRKLIKGRKYVVRLRLYYREREGETAVMLW